MKKSLLLVLILILMASVAHAGYPMRVRDARGHVVIIKHKPMRIVSLTPNNTEILFALGLGKRIVADTNYCEYPPAAKKVPIKVGDMKISVEAVIAAKPDLVIAHSFVNRSVIASLERLGLTVFAIDPTTFGQVERDIRTLGKITARPKTAERIVQKMEKTVARVKSSRAKQKPQKVLVVIQSNPLWVAGPGTFVAEMISLTNAKNVAFDARKGFVTFSKELAISRNPDVIIVGMKSDVDYFITNPVWKNTNAAKHHRVYVINGDLMVRPGPRLTDGLEQLASKLGMER